MIQAKPILSEISLQSGAIREEHEQINQRLSERRWSGQRIAYRYEANDQRQFKRSEGKWRKQDGEE